MNETNSKEAVQIKQVGFQMTLPSYDSLSLQRTLGFLPSKVQSLAESWIYVLCSDKADRLERACLYVLDPISVKRCWKLVPSLPDHVLVGGCGWFEDDEVYCYDASRNTWDTTAPLSTARLEFLFYLINSIFSCVFACEALNEKLYAIGGVCSNLCDSHSWDILKNHSSIGRLSPLLTRPPCRLGPGTVSFDVYRSVNVEGLMVSSSIPRSSSDDDVICCTVLSI
ncbi:hypothetical protein MKX03_029434 [Papaver bracteatum]|nr:hypothetical protein MKX03_029434 [Papaver bracteatum]